MIPTLLAKDLRRARRNPVPYLVHLLVPLVITGLLGMVFSGGQGRAGLGRIRLAVVDEDTNAVTSMLRGAMNQPNDRVPLDVRFLPRDEALQAVTNGEVAAALILPRGFTSRYLGGEEPVSLELVKNPAQSIHPAIIEEFAAATTTLLEALARLAGPDLQDWRSLLTPGRNPSLRDIADQLGRTGDRLESVFRRLNPPPVTFIRATEEAGPGDAQASEGSAVTPRTRTDPGIFAFLLPGMAAMFLVFIADVAMRDLQREIQQRTFERYCTLPGSPSLFVLSKVLLTLAIVGIAAFILLGIGPLLFGFRWARPAAVTVLAAGYCMFCGGLMAALAGVLGGDRRSEVVANLLGMGLALAAGCAFPASQLPPLLRDHVTPWLPPAWFIDAVRATQRGGAGDAAAVWIMPALALLLIGLGLSGAAGWLLRRRLARGLRA